MGGKRKINYKFIPTDLFRGCPLIGGFEKSPDEWATTKQVCRNPLMSGQPRNRSVGMNL